MRLLLDTSVFVAEETGRSLGQIPESAEVAVSVMTVAELRIGVLVAQNAEERGRRLTTLETVLRNFEPLPINQQVADRFAELVARLRSAGKNPRVVDTLIAATAVAHGAQVATQDVHFDDLGVDVLKL